MDEAGIPSKFRWLRNYNSDKPSPYYIEVLMGCDSETKFCWGFFVNEKSEKSIVRSNRRLPPGVTSGRGQRQTYFEKVTHYQHEYDQRTREIMDKQGHCAAQIYHFAKLLRFFDEESTVPMGSKTTTYRLFMDRRWDSLYGHYLAMRDKQVRVRVG